MTPGPKTAEGLGLIGRALGVPGGVGFPVGVRTYQLVVLITAREIDQQYEWSGQEPAGLRAGLEQSVIDVVKYDKDVTGLAEKDATLIRFFRALLREHRVSSDLWAKMVETSGRQRTIEMMALMADYFTVGTMMNAVDQHLPPDRKRSCHHRRDDRPADLLRNWLDERGRAGLRLTSGSLRTKGDRRKWKCFYRDISVFEANTIEVT